MATRRPVLEELSEIATLEPGRFAISYDGRGYEMMTRFQEESPEVGLVRRLLCVESALSLIDGDVEAAASTIPLQLRLVGPLADEPAMMAHLLQAGGASAAVRTLENVLRVGILDEETLVDIDTQFAWHLSRFSMKWALWGERVSFLGIIDEMQSRMGPARPVLSVVTQSNRKRGGKMIGWLIDACDDPDKLLSAAERVKAELPSLSGWHVFTSMTATSLPSSVTHHISCLARIRCARLALAAERFRLHNGRLPAELDQLTPTFTQEIPLDPFDRKQLKLADHEDGIIIYSTGKDGADDGGSVGPRPGERRPRDIGFRLLRPQERCLILVDEATTEEG